MTTRLPVNGLTVDLDLSGYATKDDLQTVSLTPGPKGDNGVDGKQGIQGEHGERGDVGPVGPQGERGEKGDTGVAGPQGEQGVPGQVITVDHEGKQGVEGAQGPKGDKGDKGDTGERGEQGLQGVEGPQGARGEQGLQGADGVAGTSGQKGDKGDTGVAGPKGDTGATGAGDQTQLDSLQRQINELKQILVAYQDPEGTKPVAGIPPFYLKPVDPADVKITSIPESTAGGKIILNLDARNLQSLPRGTVPGVWNDLSGNNNHATVYGAVKYGMVGGQYCAIFPGTPADYVKCKPNVYFNGKSFTIQSWVYVETNVNFNRIIDFGNPDPSKAENAYTGKDNVVVSNSYMTDGKPVVYIQNTTTAHQKWTTNPMALNRWHHVVTTWTMYPNGVNGKAAIYVDGQLATATTNVDTVNPTNVVRQNCYIGKSNWVVTQDPNMKGGIGALQIYDGALTAAEVLNNFNMSKPYYGL